MTFIQYPKIHRLGKDETLGIQNGLCYVQEKIDGANASVWMEGTEICCGSRRRHLVNTEFNGFVPYVKAHCGIPSLLHNFPNYRLYGEWLVRHTISYNETAYKQFYVFDIMHGDKFLDIEEVYELCGKFAIRTPHLFDKIENPTLEQLQQYVGVTKLGDKGEGIVIKNPKFVNQFGRPAYAKLVTQEFKENNAVVFGGNNKYSDTYWEMYVVNKYMTLARLRKIMHKLQPLIDEKLDKKHTGRIINTAYHDMIEEEIWDIQKKVPELSFRSLSKLAQKKAAHIYHQILEEDLSIAFNETSNPS